MSTAIYLLFGFLDVMANLALIFKLYRFPFWEYIVKFLIIGVTLSVTSYFTRIIIGIPEWDMIFQFILYILFFRYLIKLKLYYAVPLAAIGYLFFAIVQFTVIPILLWTQLITMNDLVQTTGLGTYFVQVTTEVTSYLIAYLMYRFGWGFSHIIRPPHDVDVRANDPYFRQHVVVNFIGTLVICSIMFWLLNHGSSIPIILMASLVALSLLVFLSYRKDYGRL